MRTRVVAVVPALAPGAAITVPATMSLDSILGSALTGTAQLDGDVRRFSRSLLPGGSVATARVILEKGSRIALTDRGVILLRIPWMGETRNDPRARVMMGGRSRPDDFLSPIIQPSSTRIIYSDMDWPMITMGGMRTMGCIVRETMMLLEDAMLTRG